MAALHCAAQRDAARRRAVLRRAGLAACVAAVLVAAGCAPGEPVDRRGFLTVGIRTAPNTLDPRLGGDETSQRVSQLIFNPLMELGPDLRARPVLAERLDNPDPLTYVAVLRRGVRFHDGHELTARDVVYTFAPFLDPAFVSPFKGAYRYLRAVTALDDYTVRFELTEPFASFPAQLVLPPVVGDGSADSLASAPVGTGPYRFLHYAVDDEVVLAAFEGYYGGAPRNRGLVLKVIPDDTMRGLELRKGSVDMVVNDLPPDIIYQLRRSGDFAVDESPGLDLSYLGVNMRDPILSDRRVRHAIAYAIDREAIVNYLRRGFARPAIGLLPPLAWAFEPDVHRFTHDPARARQLLDEAGYRDPDGDGPRPRLQLSLKISTNEETRLESTVIQQDLRRVGIDLELTSYEFATFYADVVKGNFQLFSLRWVGGSLADPDILRRVFHSQQVPPAGFNRGHYNNPEVDRYIDLATKALDDASQRKYYGLAQKLIAEDAPYIPIWNRMNAVVAQPSLTGLRMPPTGDFQALRAVARADDGE